MQTAGLSSDSPREIGESQRNLDEPTGVTQSEEGKSLQRVVLSRIVVGLFLFSYVPFLLLSIKMNC